MPRGEALAEGGEEGVGGAEADAREPEAEALFMLAVALGVALCEAEAQGEGEAPPLALPGAPAPLPETLALAAPPLSLGSMLTVAELQAVSEGALLTLGAPLRVGSAALPEPGAEPVARSALPEAEREAEAQPEPVRLCAALR